MWRRKGLPLLGRMATQSLRRNFSNYEKIYERASKHRFDLAVALQAADMHGLSEGVCNHFSLSVPDYPDLFLINPQGVHWSEVRDDDIVLVDSQGRKLAGKPSHRVETTAFQIHAGVHRTGQSAVLHTHMPYTTALTLTTVRSLDTCLSQNAMRFHGRVAVDDNYHGLALDSSEGERIAQKIGRADILFMGNHGVIVCGPRIEHAYDDLYYLERACQHQVSAMSTGLALAPVSELLATKVANQIQSEREQSILFFDTLRCKLFQRVTAH